jgi:hypothetical protein
MLTRRTMLLAGPVMLVACANSSKVSNYTKTIQKLTLSYTGGSFSGVAGLKLREANFSQFDVLIFQSLRLKAPDKLILDAYSRDSASHELKLRPTSTLDGGGNIDLFFQLELIDLATKNEVWRFSDHITVGNILVGPFDQSKADNIAQAILALLARDKLL